MKTALEILFETTNGNADYISVNNCLEAMKLYAKQLAEQALKDAEDKFSEAYFNKNLNAPDDIYSSAILSTQIVTP